LALAINNCVPATKAPATAQDAEDGNRAGGFVGPTIHGAKEQQQKK
jgi:hypothetical protein